METRNRTETETEKQEKREKRERKERERERKGGDMNTQLGFRNVDLEYDPPPSLPRIP